jgi:S-DNA-T family DNA segregation ATPase FtsK/SpoIIIE|tara:strand:- start:8145 stop:9236 length:1092 start_codon:yes stop_codon:yes gene_type:complete
MAIQNIVQIFEEEGEVRLLNLLRSFGIKTDSISLNRTKFFDIYDIKLSSGTRSSRIDRVLVDIGMSMSSHCTPRGYPSMKDGVYRLEIQRSEIESPTYDDVYKTFSKSYYAPIAIGRDEFGENLSVDLNSIPNLLVGGTTGSGKSVLLHSFVLSLLSERADIHLVDPKMVEFGMYEEFSSVKSLSNSVEETEDTIEALRGIMEKRFSILKRGGSRSVVEYNMKNPSKDYLKPIVLIVDEWADIVLQKKSIQKSLCFIAQKGRAAGISIILATQRPSASVISGLVKANFPGRIAMKVASAVDSRVILDKKGAEELTDVGTGLYLDGRVSSPILFRAPFIKDVGIELSKMNISERKKPFWSKIWS